MHITKFLSHNSFSEKSSATQGPGPQSGEDHREQEERAEDEPIIGPSAPSATLVVSMGTVGNSETTQGSLFASTRSRPSSDSSAAGPL